MQGTVPDTPPFLTLGGKLSLSGNWATLRVCGYNVCLVAALPLKAETGTPGPLGPDPML